MLQLAKKIRKEEEEKRNGTKRKGVVSVPPPNPKIIHNNFVSCANESYQHLNINVINDNHLSPPTEPNQSEDVLQQSQNHNNYKIPDTCLELIHEHEAVERKLNEIKLQCGYGHLSVQDFKNIVKQQHRYEPKLDRDFLEQAIRDAGIQWSVFKIQLETRS